jgi:hypothetical protein
VPAPRERRQFQRIACDLPLVDADNRAARAEDVGPTGICYSVDGTPRSEPHELTLCLGSSREGVRFLVRPVWVQRGALNRWRVGARVEDIPPDGLRRFQFMANALAERIDPRELRFVPFTLMDQSIDAGTHRARLRTIEIDPVAARIAEHCAEIAPRPSFLWQWAKEAITVSTLSSVAAQSLDRVQALKLYSAIFFTAVDDVADTLRDAELFDQILAWVFRVRRDVRPPTPERARLLRRLGAIWRYLCAEARRLPRYAELKGFLEFDCATFLQGVSHSLLIQTAPEALCPEEVWTAAFMLMFADLDLMCSPGFDLRELGSVRGLVLEAQQMVILTNALGTWEREVRDADYSSVVISSALSKGVLAAAELRDPTKPDAIIQRVRASDVEAALILEWERRWARARHKAARIRSIDASQYVTGLEQIFQLQMMSRGHL